MTVVRQAITGLSIALLSVALLWVTWLTGQAEGRFTNLNPQSSDCIIPTGWAVYTLQADDDLGHQAEAASYSLEEILNANCLPADANLPVGQDLYLPPELLELIDPSCGPPHGWGYYTTEAGDSLASLAEAFNVDLEQLMLANCFAHETDFEPGLRIYAPASALSTATQRINPTASPVEGSPAPNDTQEP